MVVLSLASPNNTSRVTLDGVNVMAKRATNTIDPDLGPNKIEVECLGRQVNNFYEDGEVQSFYGVSKENYDFFKGLMEHISNIDDSELEYETKLGFLESVSIHNTLRFIQEARKVPDAP